jgi:thymidine kinase
MISITNTDIIGTNTMNLLSVSSSLPISETTALSVSIPSSASTSASTSASATLPDKSKKKGYLELILGPMFSGKTSTLKKIYDQCMYCNIPVMVINYSGDKRYSSEDLMSTHDKIMIPCIMANSLIEIMENHSEKVSNAEVILINEGQFFSDIHDVIPLVEELNKRVYICGLDGDFKKNKIGSLFDLIPFCDNICKLKSLCSECRDGTPGLFSYRITNEVDQVVIGVDNYKPLCRVCYRRLTIEKNSATL